jgi:hypothetical protein
MAKSTYLGDDDNDFFSADDYDSSDGPVETTHARREPKAHGRHAARQQLDSRKEDLWLKQQLNDWGDEFDDGDRAD